MRSAFSGLFWLLSLALALPAIAQAQVPTEFLTQQVCLSGGTVTNADPVTCPGSRRHLNVGEALPYHKIDLYGSQISDSFPIADLRGITQAVQTYFFTSSINADPRFPNMVYFDAAHGGYNILGADGDNLFFRGTYDPSGGWQPWWTSDCKAKGWLIAPNTSAAFSPGSMASPTKMYPSCPGTVTVTPSSVEWAYAQFTYATSKQLYSIVSTHFASDGTAGYWGPAEITYLTREYGVTRWEAWSLDQPANYTIVTAQCPGVSYSKTMHGATYYMVDCRDWSTVTTSYAPWDPAGHSPGSGLGDANAMVWPVDPLYTSWNWLENTHVGGPYTNNGGTGCIVGPWDRINSPDVLNWAWDSATPSPFNTSTTTGNCTLIWSTPSAGGGQALYQRIQITPGGTGQVSFGAMLWAPGFTTGTAPQVTVRLFQNAANGSLISYTDISANLSGHPTTFDSSFTLNAATKFLTLTFYPWKANTNYEMTGAWIAPKELIVIPL